MRRSFSVLCGTVFMGALLGGCALHGSQSAVPAVPEFAGKGNDAVTPVTVKITVATKAGSMLSHARFPHYFSASSKGLLVRAFLHRKNKAFAQTAVDISPGSAACGGKKTTPRTCTVTMMLPPSSGDDIRLYDYNAPPKSGKIPTSAKLLAYGILTNKPIVAKKKNVFSVFLGGLIAHLNGNPAFISLPGDGSPHSVAIMIDPVDFGNNPITAGNRDPFANPITVSVQTDLGYDTLNMRLSLNGGASAESVVVKHSTDTVELLYDGNGGGASFGTVTLRAGKFRNNPATQESILVSPLFLSTNGKTFDYSPGVLALRGNGEFQTLTVSEYNAPKGTQYSVNTTKCDAVESTMPFVQTSSTGGTFSVITRSLVVASPSPTGCVIAVSDGTSTDDVQVSNRYLSDGYYGSPVIATTPIPVASSNPVEITVGPDGALWFAQCNTPKIGRVAAGPLGTNAIHEYPLPAASASPGTAGLFAGSDGNLWFTDEVNATVGKMTTAGAVVQQYTLAAPTAQPAFVTTGADNAMWFSTWKANYVGRLPTSGSPVTKYSTHLTSSYVPTMALGPDGNLWFTEKDTGNVGKITPSGAIQEFPTPTTGSGPWGMTAGPDGAMWFTECYGAAGHLGAIGRIPVTATSGSDIQEFSTGMTGNYPVDITTGPDGALWFTYWETAAKIGRITTAATPSSTTITEYAIPGASASYFGWGITSAPDRAVWFVDEADNVLGRIAIPGYTPALGRTNRLYRSGPSKATFVPRSRVHGRH